MMIRKLCGRSRGQFEIIISTLKPEASGIEIRCFNSLRGGGNHKHRSYQYAMTQKLGQEMITMGFVYFSE
jgi:hypothetical protein